MSKKEIVVSRCAPPDEISLQIPPLPKIDPNFGALPMCISSGHLVLEHRVVLRRLHIGMVQSGTKKKDGKPVCTSLDAVRVLLEQIGSQIG
jgi:hypothetical protein